MPRAVAQKPLTGRSTVKSPSRKPLTLGDLGKKISNINVSDTLYASPLVLIILLVAVFSAGYFYSRVQSLEGNGPTNTATGTAGTTGAQPTGAAAAQPKISLAKVKDAFKKSSIKFGDTNKKLIVIEVADPSCPYCHVAGGHNPELNKQMGTQFTLKSDGGSYVAPVVEFKKLLDEGKIAFSYIYYPGHGNGEMGTKALYCAQDAGKFWEVHDLLMSNAGYELLNNTVKNDKTQTQTLVDFLANAMDPTTLKTCIDSGKYDKQLTSDQALATDLQIQGTPGFYLNDTSFPGAYNFTDMESAIKAAGI